MKEFVELFTQLGLNEKESAVYTALLELGRSDVSSIAKKARIKRPTAYFILDDLIRKGYVSHAGGKVRQYVGERPQKILLQEKAKVTLLEQAIPALIELSTKNKFKPTIRFYTGLEGIKTIYEESLLQAPGSEMLAIGSAQAVEESIPHFKEWYIERRIKARVHVRALTSSDDYGNNIIKRDEKELRQTRLLDPVQCPRNIEIDIYGNKVSMVSFVEKELVGIIIESSVIAHAIRQMFEIIWQQAEKHND